MQTEVGVETILHFTTRDRNLMGLQSDLLGAHALGVRNILALTGDPPSLGDYPNATAVYDIDSVGLAKVLRQMNEGADASGAPIGMQASFTIAVAVDPTRDDLPQESDRLFRKISAGADFVMTQPIYEMATWREFLAHLRASGMGRCRCRSCWASCRCRATGTRSSSITRCRAFDRPKRFASGCGWLAPKGARSGVRISQELLLEARDEVHGVYIMPSFHRYEVAAEVLEVVRDR